MAFCHLLENLEINMVKINEYCNKNRNDAAKTASKRVVKKTAKTIGNVIGNKIADNIMSVGKTRSKEKEN